MSGKDVSPRKATVHLETTPHRDWGSEAARAFHATTLPTTSAAWRIVATLRVVASKLRQVEYIVHVLETERRAAETLSHKERPYERLFGDDPLDVQTARAIWSRLRVLEERLVLWHEDFYIHSAVLLDSFARFIFWSLPHPLRKRLPPRSFGQFSEAIIESTAPELEVVRSLLAPVSPIYQNTIKPIRDKAVVHHRPPIQGFTSLAGFRCIVMDEFRPDRSTLLSQLRSDISNFPGLGSYPEDDLELVSCLVAEAHPIIAKHADKLGIVGFAIPGPIPIWEVIETFSFDVVSALPALSALHEETQH